MQLPLPWNNLEELLMTTSTPFPIQKPKASPYHPHEQFRDASRLEALLREVVKGEVRFDDASRALYSTDASNYRQVPIGLVVPKDVADVIATVDACSKVGARSFRAEAAQASRASAATSRSCSTSQSI